jgi:hypothetical protein
MVLGPMVLPLLTGAQLLLAQATVVGAETVQVLIPGAPDKLAVML